MKDNNKNIVFSAAAVMPDGNGGWQPCPPLLTEDDLIRFLRIPEISKAKDFGNVIFIDMVEFVDLDVGIDLF